MIIRRSRCFSLDLKSSYIVSYSESSIWSRLCFSYGRESGRIPGLSCSYSWVSEGG